MATISEALAMALQHCEAGRFQAAEQIFRLILEAEPNYAVAHNNLGNVLQEQGNLEEAVIRYRRALELRPDYAMAHSNLALTLYNLGRIEEAAAAARQWLRYAPENPVALHLLAAYTGQGVSARAADQYIKDTFDRFAGTFDRQLQRLKYHAPEMIAAAVAAACGAPQGAMAILDAGCGTGWCGPALRPYARRLTGVDLSPAMLAKARARQVVYDDLIERELTAHLQEAVGRYDLVVAADTLVYFGDLQPVLSAAAAALCPRGFLIFTVERAADGDDAAGRGFVLPPHGRYCHTESYVRGALDAAGLSVRDMSFDFLRMERGEPVPGILASACKADGRTYQEVEGVCGGR
jgi:predicted TPR repeat methyltransferase